VRWWAWLDCILATLVIGTLSARLVHVSLVQWDYFSVYPEDIPYLWYGGLTWQGAVIGGIAGAWVMCRLRGVPFAPFADGLALVFPIGMVMMWAACRSLGCGYAESIESHQTTPDFFTGFLPNEYGDIALRFELQVIGIWLGLAMFIFAALLTYNNQWSGTRLWVILALSSVGMALIGFWRADPTHILYGLRLDQWFDLAIFLIGITIGIQTKIPLQYRRLFVTALSKDKMPL
jgi:phosphatidylglycerol:prolipoprotein diacylglycerol transferase